MVFGNEIGISRTALRAGWSVRVVGDRGSGRSRFVRDVADSLRKTGETVLHCIGEYAAADSAGYVLGRLASELGAAQRVGDLLLRLDLVIDEVAQRLSPEAILLIDDSHRMDPVSVRALATLRERLGLRALITEVTGADRRSGFPVRWPERVVPLRPLDLARTSALARDVLGGRLAPSAVTRAFSKTGGSPKLITALLQSARERALLELRAGTWQQTGDSLWNEDMIPVVDELFSDVGDEVRSLIRFLAVEGARGEDDLTERYGPETIERARELGAVRASGASGAPALIAWPPILVDRFRRGRARLPVSGPSPEGVPDWCGDPDKLTTLARRFVDRAARDAAAALARWNREPTIPNALDYYAVASGAPAQQQELHRVLTTTPEGRGRPDPSAFLFAFARATWVAMQEHDLDRACDMIGRFGALHPLWHDSARSVHALLELMNGQGVPEDLDDLLAPGEDPAGVREAAALMALMAGGRIAEAADLAARAGSDARRSVGWARQLLPLFEGDAVASLRRAAAAMQEAEGTLDRTLFASSAYVAVLAQSYLGEYRAVQQCVDAAVLVGRPQLEYTSVYTACLNMQGLIAVFSGQSAAKDSFLSESAMLLPQAGPFLGMGSDSFQAFTDYPTTGEAQDRTVADAVQRRYELGYVTGAAHTALASLTLRYGPETSAAFRAVQRRRPIPAFAAAEELTLGLDRSASIEHLAGTLDRLGTGQHDGLLRSLLRSAARYERLGAGAGAGDGAGRVDERRADDLEHLADVAFSNRYLPVNEVSEQAPTPPTTGDTLTPREREIALLAGALTNRRIAERLGLSVRTVENHLASALRKTGSRTRTELFELIDSRL